ncbi:MAG: LysM peptidoglycan-binding domain-containing protein [Bacteroidales bacterium]|nr:LysM peptidoglycan-binding domain-containing protein [Bacteroidales bacterium]
MNRRMKTLLAGIAFTCAAMICSIETATAQEYVAPPVTISKEKVKIDGKVFYSHIVMEKQTLFSISKAYNVSIDDLYRYNPTLKESGLKKNAIILIPSADTLIKEQETVQQSVQTPVQQEMPKVSSEKTEALGNVHIVKWYEDLNIIAEKYGVTPDAIAAANGLKDRKLKNRQKLMIPAVADEKPAAYVMEQPVEEEDLNIETAFEEKEEEATDTVITSYTSKSKVTATVLLPLKATGSGSSRSNMDFYSGVLVAARDLTELGIDVKLNVYDIANGGLGTTKSELEESDIIIGPVSTGDITRLFSMSDEIGPVISPLDPRVEPLAANYRNLVQAPSSQMAQYQDMADWIQEDLMESDRVIVISEKGARMNDEGKKMKAVLDSAAFEYQPFAYSILDGREIKEPIEAVMTMEGTNRVVIASDSEAFVNDVVRNLNLIIHDKFSVVLYGPAKIRTFETIEVENFHNTSLHASLAYYIDYEDDNVKKFLMRYRALFGTEPTQFAFQGYDVARYFLELYTKYGEYWPQMIDKADRKMLQSNFNCRAVEGGGYTNKGIRRIIYGMDYSILPIR